LLKTRNTLTAVEIMNLFGNFRKFTKTQQFRQHAK